MGIYVRIPKSIGLVNETQLRSELDRLDFCYNWLGSRSRVVEILDQRHSPLMWQNQAGHEDVFLIATVQWADENGTEETKVYASVAFCHSGQCYLGPPGERFSGQVIAWQMHLPSWREGVLQVVEALQFYLSQIGDPTPVSVAV